MARSFLPVADGDVLEPGASLCGMGSVAPFSALSWHPVSRVVGAVAFFLAHRQGVPRLRLEDGSEVIFWHGLTKAGPRGGKYLRRIPGRRDPVTGRMRWRYVYATATAPRPPRLERDPYNPPFTFKKRPPTEARHRQANASTEPASSLHEDPDDDLAPSAQPEPNRGWKDVARRDNRVWKALERATTLAHVEDALRGVKHREFAVLLGPNDVILGVAEGPLYPAGIQRSKRPMGSRFNGQVTLPKLAESARILVITHNHPSGTPVSKSDILTALSVQAHKIRAVTWYGTWEVVTAPNSVPKGQSHAQFAGAIHKALVVAWSKAPSHDLTRESQVGTMEAPSLEVAHAIAEETLSYIRDHAGTKSVRQLRFKLAGSRVHFEPNQTNGRRLDKSTRPNLRGLWPATGRQRVGLHAGRPQGPLDPRFFGLTGPSSPEVKGSSPSGRPFNKALSAHASQGALRVVAAFPYQEHRDMNRLAKAVPANLHVQSGRTSARARQVTPKPPSPNRSGWVELSPRLGRALWVASLLKGGRHRAVGASRVLELPHRLVALLDPSALSKAAAKGGKYIKRVPTGKFRTTKSGKPGAPIYKYYYRVLDVANKDHFKEGASFKRGSGHYTIQAIKDGKLVVTHTRLGTRHELTHDQLATLLHQEHGEAIKKEHAHHTKRILRDIAAAKKHNASDKQMKRLLDEAQRFGVKLPDVKPPDVKLPDVKPPDVKPPDVKPTRSETSSNKKIESVGDHIWGSRKDLAQIKVKSSQDLERLDPTSAAAITTKAKLLDPINLDHARASGMSPGTAYMFHELLSTIRAKPDNTPAGRAAYADDIRAVQGAMNRVQTADDFYKFIIEMINHRQSVKPYKDVMSSFSKDEVVDSVARSRRDNPELVYEIRVDSRRGYYARIVQPRPFDSLGARFKRFAMQSTPRNPEMLMTALATAAKLDNSQQYLERLSYRVKKIPIDVFENPDEAWAWVTAKIYPKKAHSPDKPKKPTRPGASKVEAQQRVTAVRIGGTPVADADPLRLKDTFNLREVDYGNSSYMTQADRVYHTKQLEGALHDLSDALGIEPELVSFHGRLGVAMGARGKGKAAAHYETGRGVINLTKYMGGGTLAHEWGHALDNIIAGHFVGDTNAIGATYLSKTPRHSAFPAELSAHVNAVMRAISESPPGSWHRESNYIMASRSEGEKYWASPQELFARAFETYVFDKLNTSSRKNTYLVSDAGASNVYPQGAERQRINQAFEGLMTHLRTSGTLAKALSALSHRSARKFTLVAVPSP